MQKIAGMTRRKEFAPEGTEACCKLHAQIFSFSVTSCSDSMFFFIFMYVFFDLVFDTLLNAGTLADMGKPRF